MHVAPQPTLDRPSRETLLDRARPETPASAAQEKRLRVASRERNAPCYPRFQGSARRGTDRNDALLRSLAPDAHLSRGQIEHRKIHSRKLGDTQSRRIRELEQGPIAQDKRVVALDCHQLHRLVGRKRGRKAALRLWRLESPARIVLE